MSNPSLSSRTLLWCTGLLLAGCANVDPRERYAATLAKRRHDAANLSRRDQAVQQSFYAQTVLDVAQARVRLAADREKLNRLLGLSGADIRWTTPTRLSAVPEALPTFEQIEDTALSQRVDLAVAEKELEAATRVLELMHQFVKKTEKTPQRELEVARRRLKEVKDV